MLCIHVVAIDNISNFFVLVIRNTCFRNPEVRVKLFATSPEASAALARLLHRSREISFTKAVAAAWSLPPQGLSDAELDQFLATDEWFGRRVPQEQVIFTKAEEADESDSEDIWGMEEEETSPNTLYRGTREAVPHQSVNPCENFAHPISTCIVIDLCVGSP